MVTKIKKGRIITDLCCKSKDDNQYFKYHLCYAGHIKRSIIFSQTVQLKKICPEKSALNTKVKDRKKLFRKREHPSNLVKYNPSFINLPQMIRKILHY